MQMSWSLLWAMYSHFISYQWINCQFDEFITSKWNHIFCHGGWQWLSYRNVVQYHQQSWYVRKVSFCININIISHHCILYKFHKVSFCININIPSQHCTLYKFHKKYLLLKCQHNFISLGTQNQQLVAIEGLFTCVHSQKATLACMNAIAMHWLVQTSQILSSKHSFSQVVFCMNVQFVCICIWDIWWGPALSMVAVYMYQSWF